MRRPVAALAFLLAVSLDAPSTPAARPSPPRRCPAAAEVRPVFRSAPDESIPGAPPEPVWAIPVGFVPVTDATPQPGPLSERQLASLGMSALPPSLHVLREDGVRCVARVEGYRALLNEEGVPDLRVVGVSHDCMDGSERAWASAAPFDGCRFEPARHVASRRLRDDPHTFEPRPPHDRRRLPTRYARALPPHACTAPCTTLFSVYETRSQPALAEVWVTYLEPSPGTNACNWPYTDEVALLTRAGETTRRVPHPNLGLTGVLVDAGGARVALFVDPASYGRFEVQADGTLGAGDEVELYMPSEEDGVFRSLAPYCGP